MSMSTYEEYEAYVHKHETSLKPYAQKALETCFADGQTVSEYYGRLFGGTDEFLKDRNRWRTPFQLDRDSIIYSSLFSRLSEKTQLYTGTGRIENRLTHTLKVTQITRSICRSLFLNEDLGEAIAVGHDCGHTPYAHVGETALNAWLESRFMRPRVTLELDDPGLPGAVEPQHVDSFKRYATFSSDSAERFFEHGRQSVRLLVFIRKETPDRYFTKHTLFGIWRHSSGCFETDSRFTYRQRIDDNDSVNITGQEYSSVEAQVVRYADDMAWIIADLVEGVRGGTLNLSMVETALRARRSDITETRQAQLMSHLREESLVGLYTVFISDLVRQSQANLAPFDTAVTDEFKPFKQYISFSDEMNSVVSVLKQLIKVNIINAPWVYRGDTINKERIGALCALYDSRVDDFIQDVQSLKAISDVPFKSMWYQAALQNDPVVRALAIADFVSVLTDTEVSRLSETVPLILRP